MTVISYPVKRQRFALMPQRHYLLDTKRKDFSLNERRHRHLSSFLEGKLNFTFCLELLTLIFVLLFACSIPYSVSLDYSITHLKQEIKTVEENNAVLRESLARAIDSDTLNQWIASHGFVNIDKVTYLDLNPSSNLAQADVYQR